MSGSSTPKPAAAPTYLVLLRLVIPALVVGVVSSLVLLLVSSVAERLQEVLWTAVPQSFRLDATSPVWTMLVLTLTGAAVGLIVWKMPGHAGPDPATVGLVETTPLAAEVMPKLADGRLRPIIDTAFPIAEAQAAHEHVLANRNIGKVILEL